MSKPNSPERMWAVTVDGGPCAVQVEKPRSPEPGEVLIHIDRVGICGTDLEMFEGYTDFRGIIGHEFAGTVVEADLYSWIRRRVTASINLPPNLRGMVDWRAAKHHPERSALGIRGHDGAMAEYLLIPEGLLVALPDTVSNAAGAMAEPLAAALDALDRLPPGDDPILLVGDGRLAQLIGRAYLSRGGAVEVSGRNKAKLMLLADRGASVLQGPPKEKQYRRVIEASGSPEGFASALAACAPEGTIVAKSTFSGTAEIDLARIVVDEITVTGSRCGDLTAAVDEIASGRIEVEDLVTDVFPLQEAEAAFTRAREADAIKVQLEP